MGTYNGGSTIITSREMGRSESDWMFTGCFLFGEDGFRDAKEFHHYCDLMARMRAYANNYDSACKHPNVRNHVETMIVDTMVEVNRLENGKNTILVNAIKQSQGWPIAFLEELSAERSSAPQP